MKKFLNIIVEYFLLTVNLSLMVLLGLYVGAPYVALFSGIVTVITFILQFRTYLKSRIFSKNNKFRKWMKK